MDSIRRPFLFLGILLIALAGGLEFGSHWFLKPLAMDLDSPACAEMKDRVTRGEISVEEVNKLSREAPPGMAIPRAALLDGLLIFTVALIGAAFVLTDALQGKVQGIITLLVALTVLLAAGMRLLVTVQEVLIMVGLFLAPPFGTIAYLAIWGFFNREAAAAILGISLLLKLGLVVCLLLAHPGFLKNKGLMMLIASSLLANLLTSFLHGLVPGFLVSITDGIASIVILIIVIVWSALMLIMSLVSMVKTLVHRSASQKTRWSSPATRANSS